MVLSRGGFGGRTGGLVFTVFAAFTVLVVLVVREGGVGFSFSCRCGRLVGRGFSFDGDGLAGGTATAGTGRETGFVGLGGTTGFALAGAGFVDEAGAGGRTGFEMGRGWLAAGLTTGVCAPRVGREAARVGFGLGPDFGDGETAATLADRADLGGLDTGSGGISRSGAGGVEGALRTDRGGVGFRRPRAGTGSELELGATGDGSPSSDGDKSGATTGRVTWTTAVPLSPALRPVVFLIATTPNEAV